ncbi:MAG: PAS domain-containing protein [Planctomycetes bacterium]|nr:PAS domain-containing protein [Planctomycetota bacterium]
MNIGEKTYQAIMDKLYEGVYFVDCDRKIRYWNKGAEEITGYTREEMVGRKCSDNILKHIDDTGCQWCQELCPLVKSISDGREREAKLYLHHKEGHRLLVRIRVMPVRDADEKVIGAFEIFEEAEISHPI